MDGSWWHSWLDEEDGWMVWFVMVLEGILVCYLDLFKVMSYGF